MCSVTDRHPRWVYDAGSEPDPRFSLANERTFLAWVRTALGIVAGAVALHSLGVPGTDWVRTTVVLVLLALAALCTGLACLWWARVERAMRLRQPLPAFSLGLVMTGAIVVITVLLGVALV